MQDTTESTMKLADYLGELLDISSKDAILSLMWAFHPQSKLTHPLQEICKTHTAFICSLQSSPKNSTELLYEFLSDNLMTLCSKSKAIYTEPFTVEQSEEHDLSAFLLPEFKELPVNDWSVFFPCALACSFLGESGKAVCVVADRDLGTSRNTEARKLLLKSGLLREVIYLDAPIRSFKLCKPQTLLIFAGVADPRLPISFSVVEDSQGSALTSRKIIDLTVDELFDDGAYLNKSRICHKMYSRNWDTEIGERYNLVPVMSCHRLLARRSVRGEATVRTRILSSGDFTSDGVIIPLKDMRQVNETQVIDMEPASAAKRRLRGGDILVSRVGYTNAARVAPEILPSDEVDAYVAGDNLIALRPADPSDAPLICALLNGEAAREQITATDSGALRHVIPSDLLQVFVPEISQEQDLVTEVENATRDYLAQYDELVKAASNFRRTKAHLDAVVDQAYQRQRPEGNQ